MILTTYGKPAIQSPVSNKDQKDIHYERRNAYNDCYTYMAFLLCGAHLYLRLWNLSLADSQKRFYISMTRELARNMYYMVNL